eukprot:PITA_29486
MKSFNLVKYALSTAQVLISPDYKQDFILFSLASEHTMAVVLMQKRDQIEKPIAFFGRTIKGAALKYNIIEKQALALVKALKDLLVYILHSHILAYVPNAAIKDVLVQTNLEGRRGKWIATILEYDLEIKPAKLIKGQGLASLMVESNLHVLDINIIAAMFEDEEDSSLIQVSEMFLQSPWYSNIVYVLQKPSLPPEFSKNKGRTFKLKAAKFCILNNALYWKDPCGVLLNYFIEDEAQQWGLDFIVEMHPTSSAQQKWILTATDYFAKWIEAIWTRQAIDTVIIQFLESNILSRFGCPSKIITDNADAFNSKKMNDFCNKYKITLGHSIAYYPKGNDLAESSNKSLVNIIKKLLETNKKGWHKKLVNALWADRVSQKKSIGMSPFEIVYGIDTVFPTSLTIPVVKLLQEDGSEEDDFQRRINQMIHLQQTREEVFQNTFRLQEKIKKIYDWKTKADKLQLEDVVLQCDGRNEDKGKHGKFQNLWKGPYKIATYRGKNAFLLKEMDGQDCSREPVNGRLLKHYFF